MLAGLEQIGFTGTQIGVVAAVRPWTSALAGEVVVSEGADYHRRPTVQWHHVGSALLSRKWALPRSLTSTEPLQSPPSMLSSMHQVEHRRSLSQLPV